MAYKVDQLKRVHIQIIRDFFYKKKETNKNTLSEITGISKTTCTTLLRELVEEGFICQVEDGESTGGRPTKQYQLNKDYGHSCLISIKNGVKIEIQAQIRNLFNEVLFEDVRQVDGFQLKHLYELIDNAMEQSNQINVISISIPGVVDENAHILESDIEELCNRNISILLESKYNIKTVIENDVNLAVVGYQEKEESIVFIYQPQYKYSGCGIMLNQQLYRGSSLFAGEIGFLDGCRKKEPKDKIEALRILEQQILALVCVLNPMKIIINSYFQVTAEDLYQELKDKIDVRHLPGIEIVSDLDSYIFKGLMEASMECQRNHLSLSEVRKV